MRYCYPILLILFVACRRDHREQYPLETSCVYTADTTTHRLAKDSLPAQMVAFAKTLLGTRYTFGCQAPSTGFDCSGFITYVFNHFDITVPRSSVDFTDAGIPVALSDARPGDLILFTGTDSKVRIVGHIGLVVSNDTSGVSFIHSSSGKEMQVIITPLNDYYMGRFVKVIRIQK